MIYGNFEDKYNTKNPISRFLVNNFLETFKRLLILTKNPKKIVELGIGEGELIKILIHFFPKASIWGSDISKDMVKIATKNLKGKKIRLSIEDIQKLSYKTRSFDLVVCVEVLEHVGDPKKALKEIKRITKSKALLSVPFEPLWRILNIVRGKYLNDLGNTPGHLNHFTPKEFSTLVEESGFRIILKKYPLPWQMMLVEKIDAKKT